MEALREEVAVLREENSYLKEMNQGLESENMALEEELEMARSNEEGSYCVKCEEKNTEKDELLSEVKEELENLKDRLSELNFENVSLKDDSEKMNKMIDDLSEKQKQATNEKDAAKVELSKLKDQLEMTRMTHEEVDRVKLENMKKESQRAKAMEADMDKLRRVVEDKEFQLESLTSDIVAMEAQLKIAKIRSDELSDTCKSHENTISTLESDYEEKYEIWLQDVTKQKKSIAKYEYELNALKNELEILMADKDDLENVLDEYRKKEAINMTNEQDLERMKGILLECNNWNSRKQTQLDDSSLSSILKESSTKINAYIDQRLLNFGHETGFKLDDESRKHMMDIFRSTINQRMTSYMGKTYFDEFERKVLTVASGRQLQDMMVEEYATGRKCLAELSECFQEVMASVLEVRMEAKMESKAFKETQNNLEKFKNVLRDPSFEQFRAEFMKMWLAEIRENRAAYKLQSFFKMLRQKRKSANLQKRHRSQYERFQAGSGKNLLQLLMKKVEDSICTLHEEIGILDEGNPVQNASKKLTKVIN